MRLGLSLSIISIIFSMTAESVLAEETTGKYSNIIDCSVSLRGVSPGVGAGLPLGVIEKKRPVVSARIDLSGSVPSQDEEQASFEKVSESNLLLLGDKYFPVDKKMTKGFFIFEQNHSYFYPYPVFPANHSGIQHFYGQIELSNDNKVLISFTNETSKTQPGLYTFMALPQVFATQTGLNFSTFKNGEVTDPRADNELETLLASRIIATKDMFSAKNGRYNTDADRNKGAKEVSKALEKCDQVSSEKVKSALASLRKTIGPFLHQSSKNAPSPNPGNKETARPVD